MSLEIDLIDGRKKRSTPVNFTTGDSIVNPGLTSARPAGECVAARCRASAPPIDMPAT